MIISRGMRFMKYIAYMVAVINAFWSAKVKGGERLERWVDNGYQNGP
jgi:hypothetical protein